MTVQGSSGTSRRAQASTIGVVLVLLITLVGTGLVVSLGSQAFDSTQERTGLARAEHALTQFDSQAAMVALGETPGQRVDLGDAGDDRFVATDDAGWMRVVHRNYSGTKDEVIYNATLGEVAYQSDDAVVAYQGGGVWRRQDNGTTMVSPPEFHYRGQTLTLPVIRVVNEESASGPTSALITRRADSRRIFPNESAPTGVDGPGAPYDDDAPYDNPVVNGTVLVTVHSDYYEGWADYFRTRTAGNVSVDHANRTATVELTTIGVVGDFEMANALDEDGLDVSGQASGHSVTDFSVKFEESRGTINNMYFSFYAKSGAHRYETVIHVPGGTKCNGGLDAGDTLELYTFYRNTDTGTQHEWSNTSIPADSGPVRLECDGNDATLLVNLTSGVTQTYGDVSVSDEGSYYDWDGSPAGTASFNHSDDGEPTSFTSGNETTTRHLTRHYFALLGNDFTLNARTGTGNRGGPQIDVSTSSGTLDYEAAGGAYYITYLHITENELEVDLN